MQAVRKSEWCRMLLLLLAVVLLVAAGCSKSSTDAQTSDANGTDGNGQVKVAALAGTSSAVLQAIEVAVEPAAGGYTVKVTAGPGMQDQKQLFFRLEYDGAALHSHNPTVAALDSDNGVIGLAAESEAGKLDVGIVATALAKGPAVHAGDALLSFQLLKGASDRQASGIDNDLYKARNLELVQNEGGQWILSWDYTNPGDTNQDGQVGIQDIGPIGQYYGQEVSNTWTDPRRNVDCDRNGIINLGDLVRVGQNFTNRIYSYKIEASGDGVTAFSVVGERLLSETEKQPGTAVRFTYAFPVIGGQSTYIENAWYRVTPFQEDLTAGSPSNAICQTGREVDEDTIATVLLRVENLDADKPFAHLNSVRIVYPSSYSFIKGSANTGSIGGERDTADGIWSTFCTEVLFPPNNMISTFDLGNGKTAVEIGMASLTRTLPAAPLGTGDVINFQLKNNGTEPLTLEFVDQTDDGIKRSYYSDNDGTEYWFGDHLKFGIYY